MEKVVFISGVSSGFGKTTAELLASRGFKVYGTSRKGASDEGTPYSVLKMDVRDPVSVQTAISQVLVREKRIDVLINNAGISAISPLEHTPLDEVIDMMDTNVYGALRVCQAVLPDMREQGSGLIINISSIGGLIGLPFRGIYATSKFALEGMTESLSMEVRPRGITVCLVEPGDYNTNIGQNRRIVPLPVGSVYQAITDRLIKTVEDQMSIAPDPAPVAEMIYRIIKHPNPRLRYKVGSFLEKLSVFLKIILPGRLFEKTIMGFYKL